MRVALLLVSLAVLSYVPWPAVAQDKSNLIGQETIAHFRRWERKVQSAYVLGFRGLAKQAGLECEHPTSIGETVDALTTREDFALGMTIHDAIGKLFKENNCWWPDEETQDEDQMA